MRSAELALVAAAAALVSFGLGACHDGHHKSKADLTPVVHSVPIVVDGHSNSFNVPFITITVCAPGSATNCATIDHVIVDTGSVGLRIPNATLQANPALAAALPTTQVNGQDLSECYIYAAGYFYGSVRSVDLQIAGERALSMPVQIGGDLSPVPSQCSTLVQGASEIDSPAALGGNAIIGVMGNPADCGNGCTSATNQQNPRYFGCASGGTCSIVGVPVDQQVPHPVSAFVQDNNGYSIELPSIDDAMGAVSPMGTLTFGIGTQDDNDLPDDANVFELDASSQLTTFSSQMSSMSYGLTLFDSGTAFYLVTAPSIPTCTSQQTQGLYCPTSLQKLTASITDSKGKTGSTTVKIANADSLFTAASAATTAFDDLAVDSAVAQQPAELFIMGLPQFYGKTIYFGIKGQTAGSHAGPFYAF